MCEAGYYSDGISTVVQDPDSEVARRRGTHTQTTGPICKECTHAHHALVIIVAVLLLGVAAAVFLIGPDAFADHKRGWLLRRLDTQRLKILIVTLQIMVSISATTGVLWPFPFSEMVNLVARLMTFFVSFLGGPMPCSSNGVRYSA